MSPSDGVSAVARRAVRDRVANVQLHLPLAAANEDADPEHVHQLRVSTRRGVAALDLFADVLPAKGARRLRKRLRRIRRAAGAARDLDVLSMRYRGDDSPADEGLRAFIAAQREAAQQGIVDVHDALEQGDRLRKFVDKATRFDDAGEGGDEFATWARRRLAEEVDLFFAAAPGADAEVDALHAFRIHGKGLRYTIELVQGVFDDALRGDVYERVKALQDRLGALNDHVTALEYLQRWRDDGEAPDHDATLRALIAREEAGVDESAAAFRQWWSPEAQADLRRSFDALINVPSSDQGAADAPAPPVKEIERKFRLESAPPPEVLGVGVEIAQAYLFTHRGELRVRRKGQAHIMTVKGDGQLTRSEWEISDIPQWVYDMLCTHAVGKVVRKVRYDVVEGDRTLSVDVFSHDLEGLVTLECEFESEEQAHAFELPTWAEGAVDVTQDPTFKNKSLAVRGLPGRTSSRPEPPKTGA